MFSALRRTRAEVVLSHSCALLCGLAFTGICAVVGLYALTSQVCIDAFAFDCHVERRTAERRVSAIAEAAIAYEIEHSALPKTKDDLIDNGYVAKQMFTDPWGTAITIMCIQGDIRIVSAGPDGIWSTADDITSAVNDVR